MHYLQMNRASHYCYYYSIMLILLLVGLVEQLVELAMLLVGLR
jgi:hypothetical protein